MLSAFTENASGDMTADVTVQLRYLSARIQLSAITFNGKTVTDNKDYHPSELQQHLVRPDL